MQIQHKNNSLETGEKKNRKRKKLNTAERNIFNRKICCIRVQEDFHNGYNVYY